MPTTTPTELLQGTVHEKAIAWFRKHWGAGGSFAFLCEIAKAINVDLCTWSMPSRVVPEGTYIHRLFPGSAMHGRRQPPEWVARDRKEWNIGNESEWLAFSKARCGRLVLQAMVECARNTRRIADVAQALLALQEATVIEPFTWTNQGTFDAILSVEDLLYCRRMCCYEFVHLCGWLAGEQRRDAYSGMPTAHSGAQAIVTGWNRGLFQNVVETSHVHTRNTILYATLPGVNNTCGYNHVGISMGDGTLVHLSGKNPHLARQSVNSVFWYSYGYGNVYEGNYPYPPSM